MADEHDRDDSVRDEFRAWFRAEFLDNVLGAPNVEVIDEYPTAGPHSQGAGLPALGSIVLNAQFAGAERIQSILAVLPVGGGVLTLGARVIPLPQGVSVITGVALELTAQDTRQLVVTNGGLAFLELMGYGVPGTGTGVARTGR